MTRAHRQRPVAQPLAQGLAFEQFGNDIGRALLFANIEDGKNVGMIQRRGRPGFLRETLQPVAIG